MKLFNVSYMQGNYDGSYLTVGEDTDTVEKIEARELASPRWADGEVLDSLHVKEITDIDGYRVYIHDKEKKSKNTANTITEIGK